MDPGTALGAVSLLFQVFSGCIAAYQLAAEAKGLEKDHGFIRVRFKTEQHRLLDWARVAGIIESDGIFLTNRPNRTVAMDVLDQQCQMIMSFKGLDDRFRPFSRDILFQEEPADTVVEESLTNGKSMQVSANARFPENSDLLKMALRCVEKTRKLPKRLRWVVSDRAKMENLLARLAAMNDFLRDMLDSYRGEMLRAQQIRTNYDIIQLNSKMDQLIDIIRAGSKSLPHALSRGCSMEFEASLDGTEADNVEPSQDSGPMHHLVKLAQFRAVACALQGHNLDMSVRSQIGLPTLPFATGSQNRIMVEPSALDLDVPETVLLDQDKVARRVTGWYKPMLSKETQQRIWVEWKVTPRNPWSSTGGPESDVLRRFEALVSLLREKEVTAQFRAPKCLGYYSQHATVSEIRYGLVFEIPPSVHADSSPLSLRDLITDKGRPTPSLSSRVRLMRILVESIEKLHAVDWLHKGLRSDNIIFFHDELGKKDNNSVDLSKPYLTGFDYSRPVTSVSMSEGPAVSFADDLYRHPNVQGFSADGAAGRGFRKRHDIYSLGLIITEIAYWKPLESIIGVSDLKNLKAKDVLRVREVLLSQSHLESLQSRVGDTIAEVSQACLKGLIASWPSEKDVDDSVGAEHFQMEFYEAVVRPFSALVI
ncbi:hypothetical protein N8I77_007102 [Diaporthe amygdali]|uniref:Protein kinase domain-containing protein n=1 Tax=Phomopsis amygdali TaxID=1214568 RepID=A0AAD9W121_PHOAM|nr:hypothetical protein N8I77_007102 [Diaporthe amygdali]